MGFFLQKFGLKPIKEAEVDGQEVGDVNQSTDYTDDSGNQDQQPTDYTETEGSENDPQEPNDQQENQPNEPNQQEEEPPNPGEEQTTDYTEEAPDGEDGGGNNAPPPPPDDEEQPVDDLKKQEEELYGNLTPEQLDIKHRELKSQFLAMYDITTTIIERIGDAAISEENIGIAEYISDKLSNMRDMLTDYMNNVYQGKSYIENSINYNRFLAVLNGINKILEEVEKKQDK